MRHRLPLPRRRDARAPRARTATLWGRALAACALCLALAAAWPPSARPAAPCATTLDALTGAERFATALEAFRAAGLDSVLSQARSVTVFAPDEQAFAKLPAGELRGALADRRVLAPVAAYHIVSGTVPPEALRRARDLPTLNGKPLRVGVVDGAVVLDGRATVRDAGTRCGNGIVYEIDAVLRP